MDDISPDDRLMADDDPRHWVPRADGKVYCCVTLGWVTEGVAADHRWDTSRNRDEYEREYASAWADVEPGV